MNHKIIHINYAFLTADIANKSITYARDKEYDTEEVKINLNGRETRWTDKTHTVAEVRKVTYTGTLDDCLRYLQSFPITVPVDLNEMYYEETTKYERESA